MKIKLTIHQVGVILIALLLSIAVGCTTWKSNVTTGYEAIGLTLAESHDTAKDLCDSGKLTNEECLKIKDIYIRARLAYISAGNALIVAINAEDAITKQKSFEAYQSSMNDVVRLVPEMLNLITTLKGGTK